MSESHTATQQWQSFEMRMRRRRAERCAVRAAVALEAGVLDDARAALDEALHLSPDDPELLELAARVDAAERQASVPVRRPSRRWMVPAAALILCSAAGGWLWMQTDADAIEWAAAHAGRFAARVDGAAARVAAAVRAIELPEIRLPLSTSNTTTPAQEPASQAPVGTTASHEPPVSVTETAIAVPETSGSVAGTDGDAAATSPAPASPHVTAAPPQAIESTASGAAADQSREVATAGTSQTATADRGSRAQSRDSPARASTAAAARGTTTAPSTAAASATGPRAETTTARGAAGNPSADPAAPRPREPAASSSTLPAREPVTPAVGDLASLRTREPATPPATALANPRSAEPAAPSSPEPASPRPREPAALSPIPPAAAPARALAAPVATSGGAAPAASAEQGVRATLGRYEAAYSGLDAAAASAVWPTVDRRALARAFEDLENQAVSLSKCDVKVNGNRAQADCTGSARWTPKVGSGSQSASRRWRFELRDTGGTWIITQATVR